MVPTPSGGGRVETFTVAGLIAGSVPPRLGRSENVSSSVRAVAGARAEAYQILSTCPGAMPPPVMVTVTVWPASVGGPNRDELVWAAVPGVAEGDGQSSGMVTATWPRSWTPQLPAV